MGDRWRCLLLLSVLGPASAVDEVELVNGLVLRGTVAGDPHGSAYDYGGSSGSWFMSVHLPGGPGLNLYNQQVRHVRSAEHGDVLITPEDLPPEVLATGREAPARLGAAIAPFGWRGDGSGFYPDAEPPRGFFPLWRLRLRSFSHSSPVLCGDAVLVVDQPHRLVCIDRASGAIRWTRHSPSHLNPDNLGMPGSDFVWNTFRLTTPTPVTDGTHAYVHFGHGVVACYDLDGNLRWSRQVDYSTHTLRGGTGTSPCLLSGVLVASGYQDDALIGFATADGQLLFRLRGIKGGYGALRSLTLADGRTVAFNCTGRAIDAQGQAVWPDLIKSNYGPTPTWADGVAFLADIKAKQFVAARPDPAGGAPQVLWTLPEHGGIPRSPLAWNGVLYLPSDKNLLAIDPADGRTLAQAPLRGKWSSPVAVGDRLVVVDGDRIQVYRPGKDLALEHSHETGFHSGNGTWGTGVLPVFSGNRWFWRDRDFLWCLASGPGP